MLLWSTAAQLPSPRGQFGKRKKASLIGERHFRTSLGHPQNCAFSLRAFEIRRRTNVQQLTCKIDLSSSFFLLSFLLFCSHWAKTFCFEGKSPGGKILKKCEEVWKITLWHEIITKIIPWELFFVIFEGSCALEISRKERLFQGITYGIRNFSKIIILE